MPCDNMKTFKTILLLLTANLVFSQGNYAIHNFRTDEVYVAPRQFFIDNNITKTVAYSYTISRKGKIKKDSLLLHRKQFDISKNKLFGLNYTWYHQSHGSLFMGWYDFETYYDNDGQVIKETSTPRPFDRKKRRKEEVFYDIITHVTEYAYDSLKREIKSTYSGINRMYTISSKDTLLLLYSIERPKIDDYFYNSDNQKIKWYHTVDSTRYFSTDGFSPKIISKNTVCSYCQEKYLNSEWKYNLDKKLTEWVTYTDKNKIHTKHNYFYNDLQQLVKQIDSTGWYMGSPHLESTTTFQYSSTGKIVTKINSPESHGFNQKTISYFDNNDTLIKECTFSDTSEDCTENSFVYDQNKLIRKKTLFRNVTLVTEFYYNEKELLTEHKAFRNGTLTRLIRYYYE